MTDQQQAQAAQAVPSTNQKTINLQQLGTYLDSWADIVEDMGDKEQQVRQEILKQLLDRNMPEIGLEIKQGSVDLLGNKRREYIVAETDPAVHVLICARKHGKDLFVNWRTSIASKWNLDLLKWVAIIAAGLGLFTGGIRQSSAFYGSSSTSFSLSGWIFATIVILIIEAVILVIAGKQIKGDQLAYFFQQVNLFDAEDISALNLSVHKFVLRALDNTGIDVSKLRIKQKFSGGRRGEDL